MRPAPASEPRRVRPRRAQSGRGTGVGEQRLSILLDGIRAEDYLAWVRDPEPAALGGALVEVAAHAAGNDRVRARLRWAGSPPAPGVAARIAGLPLIEGVVEVREELAAI